MTEAPSEKQHGGRFRPRAGRLTVTTAIGNIIMARDTSNIRYVPIAQSLRTSDAALPDIFG